MSPTPPGDAVLAIEPESPCPVGEVGGLLSYHLELHLADAVARVRNSGGILFERIASDTAESLAVELRRIGVRARRFDASILSGLPRVRRVRAIGRAGDDLRLQILGGRSFSLGPGDLYATHVFALPHPAARRAAADEAASSKSWMRSLRGVRALAGRPTRLTPEEKREEVEGRWFQRHHHDLGEDVLLSARAVKLRNALLELGRPLPSLHATLIAVESAASFRISQEDLDYSVLEERKTDYSLDNFLLLLDSLRAFAPAARMAERLAAFLDTLQPRAILYSGEDEVGRIERWMQLWARTEGTEPDLSP